ncbi:S-layer homology domain-containing protein [Paenibacillus ginsengarvi]|uniref:SLH domain-containing protein n=1 Tax=Paenibacillus ginsengarvi TaxID=400777 RepID=A0A3B0BXM3_9BACL|nr:S-layer homology domain-containing protein [Paenibacillus ginsengarvi]RKN78265.1 hypothetical protein D7M11_23450 [Paenibacillus ginsengarvi]
MGTVRKTFVLLFAVLVMLGIGKPGQRADAASINRLSIMDLETFTQVNMLIAGKGYYPAFDSDSAIGTSMYNVKFEYTTNNGATWTSLPFTESGGFYVKHFQMPIDPQLTSAKFRISAYFDPLIGSKTYSEKTIGPFPIMQPADPTDFTAIANDDGTVTLKWIDNSNMESSYLITRRGPDGTKTFSVKSGNDRVAPISYTDKTTDTKKSTLYSYQLSAIVDAYKLPDNLMLAEAYTLVKTKVPISLRDIYKIDSPIMLDKWSLELFKDPNKAVVTGVALKQRDISLAKGQTAQLVAIVSPADAANPNVKWSSSNSAVAEVDANGKVTAKSAGAAKISVKTEVGNFSDVCTVTVTEAPLADIEGHWAKAWIAKAVQRQIVDGYEDGTFKPDNTVTRAEFTVLLMKGLKLADEGKPLEFADKEQIGGWALIPVQQAVKLGIIGGYDDGTFRPNANITRTEMIAMVVRASGLPVNEQAGKTRFADDADIASWARPAVSKAEETGIIIVGGLPVQTFGPSTLSTRAEAVSSIVAMLELGK